MKILISTVAFVSLLFFTSYAQDNNKPQANSFGVQYGVFYNGTLAQTVQFSGWLEKGLEIRGGTTVSIMGENISTSESVSVYTLSNNTIPGTRTSANKSGSVFLAPYLSLVKHFPIKSKLDFFLGGMFNTSADVQTRSSYNSYDTTAQNYYHLSSTSMKNATPLSFGLSAVGGSNFFFYKDLALGADISIGYTMSTTVGSESTTNITSNSGSNNPQQTNTSTSYSVHYSGFSYSFALAGYAGLHLIYYLKVNNKKIITPKM